MQLTYIIKLTVSIHGCSQDCFALALGVYCFTEFLGYLLEFQVQLLKWNIIQVPQLRLVTYWPRETETAPNREVLSQTFPG